MSVTLGKNTFTLVDVETTGGNPFTNRVIEVAAIRFSNGKITKTFSSLVNPEASIPSFITSITGLTDRHVSKAPVFKKILPDLENVFKGSIFVAHNVNFDYQFLRGEYLRFGKDLELPKMCTVRLSRLLYPEHKRHGLSSIIERFGFECEARHRALGDAQVLWDFLQKIRQDFEPKVVSKALNSIGDW